MKLDLPSAEAAVKRIGEKLGLDPVAAARGIVAIAANNMAAAIRTKTVARGVDPREYVLLAYGGGGGLFACAVAEELAIRKILVPSAPANFSAWGILTSNYMEDEVRTKVLPFTEQHISAALETLAELQTRATGAIRGYGFPQAEIGVVRRMDLRFLGQEYTLTITLNSAWADKETILDEVRGEFVRAHRQLYGHGEAAAPMELVAVRCRATGAVRPPQLGHVICHSDTHKPRERVAYFQGTSERVLTPVMERDSLQPGIGIPGPVILEEWTTTTVVPPGWRATRDDLGNVLLELS
jgi:N-methylhydantoinase A